jgi:hypothetical protein
MGHGPNLLAKKEREGSRIWNQSTTIDADRSKATPIFLNENFIIQPLIDRQLRTTTLKKIFPNRLFAHSARTHDHDFKNALKINNLQKLHSSGQIFT